MKKGKTSKEEIRKELESIAPKLSSMPHSQPEVPNHYFHNLQNDVWAKVKDSAEPMPETEAPDSGWLERTFQMLTNFIFKPRYAMALACGFMVILVTFHMLRTPGDYTVPIAQKEFEEILLAHDVQADDIEAYVLEHLEHFEEEEIFEPMQEVDEIFSAVLTDNDWVTAEETTNQDNEAELLFDDPILNELFEDGIFEEEYFDEDLFSSDYEIII